MKSKWLILFLFCMASAHAQMYRWVDADGRVIYSDQPPPPSVKKIQKKSGAADGAGGAGLNYALAEASRNFPVTLYTSSECVPCDEGRALLKKRGIPYAEKTVSSNEDVVRMKQAGGTGQIPFLTVGRSTQTGFEAGAWNAMLTVAGYPETSQLPSNYKFDAPIPAAPSPVVAEKPAPTPQPATPPPPAQGATIPGFRF